MRTSTAIGAVAGQAVAALSNCRGRVIFTGMGKMGHIARKAAATFCSTGAPALFLHPVEAFHGDIGIVSSGDILVALSASGESNEVIALIPFFRARNNPVIAITGRPSSQLAVNSQIVLPILVDREADPDDIAPTSSTTVALAICDALAVSLMRLRGFTREQFAEYHPGGFLGRKLLTVGELMHTGERFPSAGENASVRDAIVIISRKGLGCVVILDESGRLTGIFTDGDLRRALGQLDNPLDQPLTRFMTIRPATTTKTTLAAEAIALMEQRSITVLPVIDSATGKPEGIIHLHDLIQAGLA